MASYPGAAARTVTLDDAQSESRPSLFNFKECRMPRIRQHCQSHQKLSPVRFAAALALALLTAIGGAAVMVWNTQDLMAVLGL